MNLFEVVPTDDTSAREEIFNKWKDKPVEELLKAKVEADLFINTLTKRQDDLSKDYLEMKKQVEAQASLQELVDKLNAAGTSNSALPKANEGIESQPFKLEDIDKRVKDMIEETRRNERQTANATLVQTKLKERYGNSYQDVLRNTGLSDKQIQEIAMDSPEAIFRLVGIDNQKEGFQAPPRSNQRSDSFAPKGQTKRDWNYYQELKKANPYIYLDRKIANQMHDDAVALGDDFGFPPD